MKNFWIVPGSEENWKQSFISKGIWGLEETKLDKIYWLAISSNDVILFYVSGKVKGIVGYGIIRNKFYQNVPLWNKERKKGCVIWPLRFEFDVEFILPENMWKEKKIPLLRGGQFRQPLILKEFKEIEPIIYELNPNFSHELFREISTIPKSVKSEILSPKHEDIKNFLLEIGKLQGYVVDPEFPIETERLDVVWRRLPESVPTYAFEVQLGGDLYHAMGKLKHAYDIWNSRIFIVSSVNDVGNINNLLSGTFHEIKKIIKFIEIEKIHELYKSKRNIYKIEIDLGILP